MGWYRGVRPAATEKLSLGAHVKKGRGGRVGEGRRRRSGRAGLFVVLWALSLLPAGIGAQVIRSDPAAALPPPPDTYSDQGIRLLVARAMGARGVAVTGIHAYEALLRERIYVGLTAFRIRRERGLFHRERVARVGWSEDGTRTIQWIGARQAIPVIGADTRREALRDETPADGDLRGDLVDELLAESDLLNFSFDPGADRVAFGDDWALHPLSDSAAFHYRYRGGDTLILRLPERTLEMVEVRVEPRREDVHLIVGSLWFDSATGHLVRAIYRPARPFDLSLDAADAAADVPGFVKPITADVAYITVEYSLQEFEYWLPRRFAMEVTARAGRFLSVPVTVEWTATDYRVNEVQSLDDLLADPPPGWRVATQLHHTDTDTFDVRVLLPPDEEVFLSPELSTSVDVTDRVAFTHRELSEIRDHLGALGSPFADAVSVRLSVGPGQHRFNRVEGVSPGATLEARMGPSTRVSLSGRIGLSEKRPRGTAGLVRIRGVGEWGLWGYRRLEPMGDWDAPFGFTTSLSALAFGGNDSQFFESTGAALSYSRAGSRVRGEVRLARERQAAVVLGTDFHFLRYVRDGAVTAVLPADEGSLTRGILRLNWFSGVDPNGLILTGEVLAEGAVGDFEYQRGAASISASHPLFVGLSGALQVGGGRAWGELPVQRYFHIGGAGSLRAFPGNAFSGRAFWRSRAEVTNQWAGARVGVFGDAAWVGDPADLTSRPPYVSLGLVTSLMDGLIRFDVGRAVRGGSGWGFDLYLDGLL